MTTAVIVLAGGEGRRIGGDKPIRRLGAQSLIEIALQYAQRLAPIVALAVREPDQLADAPVERILDMPGIGGPLAGLGTALQFAAQRDLQMVLTLPCDAPFLPNDLLARLSDALVVDRLAAVPASGGHLHPICTLWRVEALDRLPSYLETGRTSLIGFAEHAGFVQVDWPVDPFDPFFNINSAEDLALAEGYLGRR